MECLSCNPRAYDKYKQEKEIDKTCQLLRNRQGFVSSLYVRIEAAEKQYLPTDASTRIVTKQKSEDLAKLCHESNASHCLLQQGIIARRRSKTEIHRNVVTLSECTSKFSQHQWECSKRMLMHKRLFPSRVQG